MGIGLILGVAAVGGAVVTAADRYLDIFGLNPGKDKWFWEREPFVQTRITRTPKITVTPRKYAKSPMQLKAEAERRMIMEEAKRQSKYTITAMDRASRIEGPKPDVKASNIYGY